MTLPELVGTLSRIVNLPAEARADAIGALAAAQAKLLALVATPTPSTAPSALVNADEMARLLGVPANWIRDKARAGLLPVVQLGHYVRFDPAETLAAARRVSKSHDAQSCRAAILKQDRGSKSPGVPVLRGAA